MKCVLPLAIICVLLVLADSVKQCKHRNVPCLARSVCNALGGKIQGGCFHGVCCQKRDIRRKQCKTPGTMCMAEQDCKYLKGRKSEKCFRGVCCKTEKERNCTLYGGECQPKNTSCSTLKNGSKTCGKDRKCCVWLN
uniref:Putative carboxypeptidase inhibitor n=1 Tax=Rhipicephalus pulchellus TaxID=72859 RepID=L7M9P8_RHIPC